MLHALIYWLLMLGLEFVDRQFGNFLTPLLALYPRQTGLTLVGIITSHFLHVNWTHFWENSIPYFLFALLICLRNNRDFPIIFWGTALGAGMGTWAIGRGVSLGASGIVFGMLGFLLSIGWVDRRNLDSLLASGIATAWFSSTLTQILPWGVANNVSWEGHLSGFLAGIGLAIYRGKQQSWD